jgi:hypothetical protein
MYAVEMDIERWIQSPRENPKLLRNRPKTHITSGILQVLRRVVGNQRARDLLDQDLLRRFVAETRLDVHPG